MGVPLSETQTALVTRLRGDSGVQAAMTNASAPLWNIYDYVPTNQGFPYLWIPDIAARQGTALSMGPTGQNAHDLIASIHIFSQYGGSKEIQAIISAIDTSMQKKPLTLANGYTNFFCLFDSAVPPVLQPDGLTRHAIQKYKLMTVGG